MKSQAYYKPIIELPDEDLRSNIGITQRTQVNEPNESHGGIIEKPNNVSKNVSNYIIFSSKRKNRVQGTKTPDPFRVSQTINSQIAANQNKPAQNYLNHLQIINDPVPVAKTPKNKNTVLNNLLYDMPSDLTMSMTSNA